MFLSQGIQTASEIQQFQSIVISRQWSFPDCSKIVIWIPDAQIPDSSKYQKIHCVDLSDFRCSLNSGRTVIRFWAVVQKADWKFTKSQNNNFTHLWIFFQTLNCVVVFCRDPTFGLPPFSYFVWQKGVFSLVTLSPLICIIRSCLSYLTQLSSNISCLFKVRS